MSRLERQNIIDLQYGDLAGRKTDGSLVKFFNEDNFPVVPSTAQFYLPDLETILPAIIEINSNYGLTGTATYSSDILWSTFTSSNVNNGTPQNPNDLYIAGFYNEVQYVAFGNDILQIAYTGNLNLGNPTPSYQAAAYNVSASIDTATYDILNYVNLSYKGSSDIFYEWTDTGSQGTDYEMSGNFTNIQTGTILTFAIDIDIPNDTASWSIGILP